MAALLARLARSGALQGVALGDAASALQCELLRPGAAAAAAARRSQHWRRGAATEAGDQPAATATPAADAAPKAAAEAKPEAAAAAAPQAAEAAAAPQAAAAPKAAAKPAAKPKQQQQQAGGKQQRAQQHSGGKGKPVAAKPAGGKQQAPKAKPGPPPPPSPPQQQSRLSGKGLADLLAAPVNSYVDVPAGILAEATKEFYEDPVLKGDNVHEPDYGCKAVHAEWEWSGRRSLLARQCMQDLVRTVEAREKPQLYLDGFAGSGKSVALYSLVAWARAHGWLALYVPSAFSLVQNGTFTRGEDGLWDTPEAARWVLAGLREAHAPQLADLKTPSGQPLSELVEEGLAPGAKPDAVVAAAVAAKEAVAAQRELPALLAVDDYNVLYSHTGYYESVHNFHRRQLSPDELRLARAFRVLEQAPPAHGVAVAAPTMGQTVSAKLRLPLPRGCRFAVPRYGLPEVTAAAEYYAGDIMGGTSPAPDEASLRRALFLTAGNGRELREFAPGLLGEGDLLGLSVGYKVLAAERHAAEGSGV